MPLEISQTKGLWVNTGWDPAKPGVFALVIGVSKYDHLTGDDQSYGLGQLHVSALTAYRFFSWLKEAYRHPDLPLAQVWLLLAPTDAELQLMPGLPSNGFRPPTFTDCDQAIGEWYGAILSLNSLASEKSRTLFFFSGHGLEVNYEKQILLPSDYLSPPVRNVNKALSTYNLCTGVRATPIPEHFFFLDACRNDHQKLRELSLEGWPVLNSCPTWRGSGISPIVHATGPGAAAWSPTNPQEGISVFGQALVECLECAAGVEAYHDNNHYWITFRELEDYLSPRVANILEGAGFRINQPVQISFAAGKRAICEVQPKGVLLTVGPQPPQPAVTPPSLFSTALPKDWQGPADSRSIGNLHRILHSESVTSSLWDGRVFNLDKRQWTNLHDTSAAESLKFREIARTDDRKTFQYEVEMQQSSAQWFEVTMGGVGQRAACLLIGDQDYQPRYTLRFDFMMDSQGNRLITGLDVSLANSSPGVVGEAAQLWNQYRVSDIGKGGTPLEFTLLEKQLMGKGESPLAATVAALLLLRAWRPDLLHDWLKNLANWFPKRPDGWVIWVEQLLRTKQDQGLEQAITAFLNLEQLPLPLTSEGLGHASRQVGELLLFAFPKPENQTAEQKSRYAALGKLQQRLNKALAVFRPGGFSAVFIGPPEAVVPELILPL